MSTVARSVAVLAVVLAPSCVSGGAAAPRAGVDGDPGEVDLRLWRQHGGQWDLASERGNIVLINYFATWCAPCVAEWPLLIELQNRFRVDGLRVVAVSMDAGPDSGQVLRAFLGHFSETNFPILLAGERTIAGHPWPIPQLPTTIIVDRQGRPLGKWEGMLPPEETEALIRDLVLDQDGR